MTPGGRHQQETSRLDKSCQRTSELAININNRNEIYDKFRLFHRLRQH